MKKKSWQGNKKREREIKLYTIKFHNNSGLKTKQQAFSLFVTFSIIKSTSCSENFCVRAAAAPFQGFVVFKHEGSSQDPSCVGLELATPTPKVSRATTTLPSSGIYSNSTAARRFIL